MLFERYEYFTSDVFIDGWLTTLMNKFTRTSPKSVITLLDDDFVVVNPQKKLNVSRNDVTIDLFNVYIELRNSNVAKTKLRPVIRRLSMHDVAYDDFDLVEDLVELTFYLPRYYRAKVSLLISFLEN